MKQATFFFIAIALLFSCNVFAQQPQDKDDMTTYTLEKTQVLAQATFVINKAGQPEDVVIVDMKHGNTDVAINKEILLAKIIETLGWMAERGTLTSTEFDPATNRYSTVVVFDENCCK